MISGKASHRVSASRFAPQPMIYRTVSHALRKKPATGGRPLYSLHMVRNRCRLRCVSLRLSRTARCTISSPGFTIRPTRLESNIAVACAKSIVIAYDCKGRTSTLCSHYSPRSWQSSAGYRGAIVFPGLRALNRGAARGVRREFRWHSERNRHSNRKLASSPVPGSCNKARSRD